MTKEKYYNHEKIYKKIFAEGGKGWEDYNRSKKDAYKRLKQFLNSRFAPKKGLALDVGCGGGQAAFLIEKNGFNVFGIDYSTSAIKIAKKNAKRKKSSAKFKVADALKMPFSDDKFDLVADNHTFHCIVTKKDREQFAKEVYRVLKKRGIFFTATMQISKEVISKYADKLEKSGKSYHSKIRYWTSRDEFVRLLKKNKFKILHINDNGGITVYATKCTS